MLPAFTCARANGNLRSICLGVKILRFEWSETLATWPQAAHADILEIPIPWMVLYLVSDTVKE